MLQLGGVSRSPLAPLCRCSGPIQSTIPVLNPGERTLWLAKQRKTPGPRPPSGQLRGCLARLPRWASQKRLARYLCPCSIVRNARGQQRVRLGDRSFTCNRAGATGFDASPVRCEYLIRGSCVVAKGVFFTESRQPALRTEGGGAGLRQRPFRQEKGRLAAFHSRHCIPNNVGVPC